MYVCMYVWKNNFFLKYFSTSEDEDFDFTALFE